MFNPPHPAEVLKEDILPELGLTVTEAAKQLGVNFINKQTMIYGKQVSQLILILFLFVRKF